MQRDMDWLACSVSVKRRHGLLWKPGASTFVTFDSQHEFDSMADAFFAAGPRIGGA